MLVIAEFRGIFDNIVDVQIFVFAEKNILYYAC